MPTSPPRPSIALRMSVWYALSVTLLLVAVMGALYSALAANMEREDRRTEADEIANVRVMLGETPQRAGASSSGNTREEHQVYVRLLSSGGAIERETPGLRRILPPPSAAALHHLPASGLATHSVTPNGRLFETLTIPAAADGSARSGFVQVAMDRSQDEALAGLYRRRLLVILVIALLVTVAAGHVIGRAALRPIRRVSAAAAQVGSSNLHARIARAGLPIELWSLTGSFNQMLDRLEDAFARSSRFTDDVAHELRTPINNMRGELEVALSRARTPDEYRDALSSALEETDRLGRITRRLLFLARADDPSALQREDIDVARELEAVREFYDAAASERGVSLRLRVGPGLTARLDRTLFQQAAGNLVSNAIRHTSEGGEVRIDARGEAAGLRLVVSDTGCGVAAEHLPHLFDRFYRVDPARGGPHVGLGLAVVRSIVERHGGQASIDSVPGQGARLQLFFPS